ncbi:MAG: molybdopterin-dependent oxidoreductase [Thermoproteus sp.]
MSYLKINRRELVKLGVTIGVVSALGAPLAKIALSQTAQPIQKAGAAGPKYIPIYCGACGSKCGLYFVNSGDAMYIVPNPSHPQPGMCARPAAAIQMWGHPLRLRKPLKRIGQRGEGKFQEVDWDTALNEAAAKLKEVADRYGPQAIAFTRHDHMSWHLPLIASLIGTPNVIGHEGTCHDASTAARQVVLGAGGPPAVDPDYANLNYLLLIGRNLDAAMGLVRALSKAREAGAKVVVVDPRAPNLAFSSVEWVPIIPGTDAALLLSMIYVIINEGLYDVQFLKKYTNAPMLVKPDGQPLTQKDLGQEGSAYLVFDAASGGLKPLGSAADPALDYEGDVDTPSGSVHVKTAFRLLAERAAKYPPEKAAQITGIPADEIIRLAREFATRRGVAEDGWYAAKNGNEFDVYRAILILNALVGNIDKRGGLCFQEPAKFPNSCTIGADRIDTIFGVSLPPLKAKRVDTMKYPLAVSSFDALLDAVLTEKPYPVKALVIVGTAPFHRDVNTQKLKEAFKKLDLVVTIDILPQDHVDWSDYVFPDLMFLERSEISSAPWTLDAAVVYSNKVLDPPPGVDARHAFWILLELVRRAWPDKAALIGYTDRYADYAQFEAFEEQLFGKVLDYLSKTWNVSKEELETSLRTKGYYVLKRKTYEVKPYKSKLSTPTGLVEIYSLAALKYGLDPLPDWTPPPAYSQPKAPDEFYLVTGKDQNVSGHFAFTYDSKYLTERCVWMNPADAERLGVRDGDVVTLEGVDNGFAARTCVKVTNRVRPGVLFAYAFAGGHTSALVDGRYDFLRTGVNPQWFTKGYVAPVIGTAGTNSVVRVRL